MSDLLKVLEELFSLFTRKETRMCQRCRALEGEVMCDRSLLGEIGACRFRTLKPCAKCGSYTPCFGHPCELSDRLTKLREGYFPK